MRDFDVGFVRHIAALEILSVNHAFLLLWLSTFEKIQGEDFFGFFRLIGIHH